MLFLTHFGIQGAMEDALRTSVRAKHPCNITIELVNYIGVMATPATTIEGAP